MTHEVTAEPERRRPLRAAHVAQVVGQGQPRGALMEQTS
jgi:hypothetical protein